MEFLYIKKNYIIFEEGINIYFYFRRDDYKGILYNERILEYIYRIFI